MKFLPLLLSIPLSLFAIPSAPTDLELIPTKNSISIKWSDNEPNETGYKIYRDDKLIFITKPNIHNYIDKNLQSNHTYEYTIKATDDAEVDSKGTFFLQALTNDAHHIIVDNDKNLMWVNEYEYDKHACLAVHGDRENDYETSKDFCSLLNFADFDDWRDPNADELQNFVIKTNQEQIETGYLAPCKYLLSRESGTGEESAIASRYNKKKVLGEKQPYQPYQYNIGGSV
jgi:hypothetical protein